jgi:RNA polymerase sigma-70 factor (ECF subfamily)
MMPISSMSEGSGLLSSDATLDLLEKARAGDREAVEALLQRSLPPLKRWAHGRLPAYARGGLDTGDLVQDAALHLLQRLDAFQPQHVGALQAYLRMSVINRIRDQIRKTTRQPAPTELPEDLSSDRTSPLEIAIRSEAYERYRFALGKLAPKDRELVVARVEAQWSAAEIADQFGHRTISAARMAILRAVRRLIAAMHQPG